MGSLARAARKSNQAFLQAGLRYAELTRAQAAGSANVQDLDAKQHEAEVRWRLARKNVHIAFGNFASAFYRMMDEPVKRQNNVPELNNRSEEHTSELQSLMRISYAVFCLKQTTP